ncbi:MAG: beta-ketoacyl synthase [Endozoicomonadaceae bacterium]|nr:beta-ketoacyl synthase [Endozoicomonadaceae bacterium]
MSRLAVIVAQGGISSAGRTSGFNAYKRMVFDQLNVAQQQTVLKDLKVLCNANISDQNLLDRTLIRKLHVFDPDSLPTHKKFSLLKDSVLVCKKKQIPDYLKSAKIESIDDIFAKIYIQDTTDILMQDMMQLDVRMAAQLPEGFEPEKLYQSKSHPRGLAMTVYGASDALQSMGVDWHALQVMVPADQISVYAGSSMSQLDQFGNGGLLQARLLGRRVTPKQLPLGFAEMPADFMNAYILGSLGSTGTNMGACATFLYNLKQGISDICTGRSRVAIIGNSEAPLTPEIFEGYAAMGALATDAGLRKLDHLKLIDAIHYPHACRPFSDNCGFVLGESAQFFVLMDDALALETGATILGAVADVFVNADGPKKSIASPGAGNYITMMKAVSLGRSLFGQKALQESIVYAHGTGTPQNRVTESHILNEVAKVFSLNSWKVAAIKSHLGHSLATASGDQLMTALGAWHHGIIPSIPSIQSISQDVCRDHLAFTKEACEFDVQVAPFAFINAKGFGGNNATAAIISPYATQKMLQHKHGEAAISNWKLKSQTVQQTIDQYEDNCHHHAMHPIYKFGEQVIESKDIILNEKYITLKDFTIHFESNHAYSDFLPHQSTV